MGIRAEQYSNFTMLRQRVLDAAVKEINAKTDIETGYELDKQGRQTIGILFRMKPKQAAAAPDNGRNAVREQLLHYGLSAVQADELLHKHDLEYLQANIAIVKEQADKGAIKNAAAYLLKALQVDYRPTETQYGREQKQLAEQRQKEQEQKEQEAAQLQELKTAYATERKQMADAALQSLPEEKTAWYKAAFLDGLTGIFKKYYTDKGREHPMLQAHRYSFVAKTLLPEQYHTQGNYISFKTGTD